ncbi:MAG: CDP-alcohol phosphatidyltransferase family protein [Gracilimonas sp.]|nr:CDP-alcohol phosphatidyltransferase family protein [Gracilimonas sp.]
MSKLPDEHKFIDLSDYGRPLARLIANSLKETKFTPIHVTTWFVISGLVAITCILTGHYNLAAIFLILKSILDAADGELARVKKTPSYTGRYLDSVSDFILNLLIIVTIWSITNTHFIFAVLAFFGLQLQGTLYNYYYVILRTKVNGDKTSQIFENEVPEALKGEKQQTVNILFRTYKYLYGLFDKTIYALDSDAAKSANFPKWLMTPLSTFGLGFQLLIISIFLVTGVKELIIPFFIAYSFLIFVFIGVRKLIPN